MKIKQKNYYRIEFELVSPLIIGGDNYNTDKDVLRGSDGRPYIPGSAMAGVFRALISQEKADDYFGYIEGQDLSESNLIVYDAKLLNSDYVVSTRDMVKLEDGVAVDTGKFDMEIVEPVYGKETIKFVTYLEQNVYENKKDDIASEILGNWKARNLKFGSKTTRGYGETKLTGIKKACFDFHDQNSVQQWLDFDLYDGSDANWKACFDEIKEIKTSDLLIQIDLKQNGGLSIRQYSAKPNEPDYRQLTRNDDKPVSPGTSWSGVFRSAMSGLVSEEICDEYFGYEKGKYNSEGLKSRIIQKAI